jgi:hypothetical protein
VRATVVLAALCLMMMSIASSSRAARVLEFPDGRVSQECRNAERCLASITRCVVNDGNGGYRQATPEERDAIIDWYLKNCRLPAADGFNVIMN